MARVSKEIERNIGNLFLYDKAGRSHAAIVSCCTHHPWQPAGASSAPGTVMAACPSVSPASCSCAGSPMPAFAAVCFRSVVKACSSVRFEANFARLAAVFQEAAALCCGGVAGPLRLPDLRQVLQKAICPEKRAGLDSALSAIASVTEVRLSNDLQVAKVYISIFSDERGKETAMRQLNKLQGCGAAVLTVCGPIGDLHDPLHLKPSVGNGQVCSIADAMRCRVLSLHGGQAT